MKTIHVICNPAARRGHTVDIYRDIKAWSQTRNDIQLSLHMTASETDATEFAKQLTSTNEDTYILIIGGDGTISEVVNGIVNFEHTYLMILPFGSGNDLVYTLGIPQKDPVELMKDYMGETEVFKSDYLVVNGKYRAINSTGLGISSETIKCRNNMKHFSPKTQYAIASFRKGLFYKNFTYWVSFDGQPEFKLETAWFVGNNGKRVGGNILATPDAKLDDGYIDVMYLEKFKRIHVFEVLNKCLHYKIKKLKYAKFVKCKEFTLVLKDNCVEYDGHLLDHLNALHVKIGEGKVNFILPKKKEEVKNS